MNCGMDGWMYAWRVLVREIGRDEGGNKGTGELWLCNESLIHLVKGMLSLIHPSCERKAGKTLIANTQCALAASWAEQFLCQPYLFPST